MLLLSIGNAQYNILSWLDLKFQGWTTLAKGSGSNIDQDWRDPDPAPENTSLNSRSNSSATVNYVNMFDISIAGRFYQNDFSNFSILAGYKESRYSWTSYGGYFQDFDDPNENQSLQGAIVGYRQTYKTPYVGLEMNLILDKLAFNTQLKYSDWVRAKDYDNHYLRNGFISVNKSNSSRMISITQEIAYAVSPAFQVVAEASWNKYYHTRADYSGTTGESDGMSGEFNLPGAGGLSAEDYTIITGVRYRF
ncbi:omptin family outer membrane protease [Enterobacter bugandensis]